MAAGVDSKVLIADGDAAFLRVNNRLPAHALAPGEAASARNVRFEQGQPRPRFGVALDAWGVPGTNLATTTTVSGPNRYFVETVTLEVGATYLLLPGNATGMSVEQVVYEPGGYVPGQDLFTGPLFTAEQATYYIFWNYSEGVTYSSTLLVKVSDTCAYGRFSDPVSGHDMGVLVTSEWRDDGGRGRAWRILSGNAPMEIPLNGHDVWGTARLVQCRNSMILLRHGDERHYFDTDALNGTTDEITLNCAPSWGVGTSRRVRFEPATTGAMIDGTAPPAAGNYYYARHYTGNKLKLFTSAADATAGTNALDWATSGHIGKFYLELATSPKPFFGNGAPNLIMQGDAIGTPSWEVGFEAVTNEVEITDTDTAEVTCPNHGFVPGDAVTQTGITIATPGPYYAYPIDEHHISLHSSAEAALTGSSPISDITANGTGTIAKTNASGLPMPPCREGAYLNGRFWGINEWDTVVYSDPNDFLHFTLYRSTLAANQGEAGRANWIRPLGEGAIVIGKDQKLLVLTGVDMDTSGWREGTITGEYGGIAALAATPVGTNLWCLSRKGVARAIRTVAGEKLAEAETVSDDIPEDLKDIDWARASLATSDTWNGRYFLGVAAKGQEDPVNNKVLVYNFRNTSLGVEQQDLGGEIIGRVVRTGGSVDSWEGVWNGDLLTPYAFSRLTVNGEERLTFATPNGVVCWLHDGWDDSGVAIENELLTRGYFGGREMLILKGQFVWDSFNPSVTAEVVTAGVGEEETLSGFDALTYDRTAYTTDGTAAYNPSTSTEAQFDAPDREDYSPSPEELLVARLDVHQNLTEPFRCRVRGRAPQFRLTNTQGSLRLCGLTVQGRPAGTAAERKT